MRRNQMTKKSVALLLCFAALFSLFPTAMAALEATNSSADYMDANASVTNENFYCTACGADSAFTVRYVPEYTKDGVTALSRNIKYSDGTMADGVSKGSFNDGTPGVDAYFTGSHWVKAVCESCQTFNSHLGPTDYGYGKSVYILRNCESLERFPKTESYECLDGNYHAVTTISGDCCVLCRGKYKAASTGLEPHELTTEVLPQPDNARFAVVTSCSLCGYSSCKYVAAKAVIADYYGAVDGKRHTITVSDLSESGVTTQIRYGSTAESYPLATVPLYREEGRYAIYYEIVYTYQDASMTENGVAYVNLGGEDCICGHEFRDFLIRKPDCETDGRLLQICSRCGLVKETGAPGGEHIYKSCEVPPTCISPGYTVKKCSICEHRQITHMTSSLYHKYEAHAVPASCESGGRTVYICEGCGRCSAADYTEPVGHDWDDGTRITGATCTDAGETEYRCVRCGCRQSLWASATGHTPGKASACTEPQICITCGTIISDALGHDYIDLVTSPNCTEMGYTVRTCSRCGDSVTENYVEALGHKPSGWIIDLKPTTGAEGSRHRECSVCGEILETETIARLPVVTVPEIVVPEITVPEITATEHHGVYVVGRDDGNFSPDHSITRAEAAAIFARLLAERKGDFITTAAVTKFKDIPSNIWYSGYVKYLTNFGVIYGRADDQFVPDDSITRAEFTAMAVRFFDEYGGGNDEIKEQYAGFTDVSEGYWASEYIRDAAIHGWINGYNDGTFRADNSITRAETVTLINRLLGREADRAYISANLSRLKTFPDVEPAHWAYYDILEAANTHDAVSGKSEKWKM